MRTRDLEAIGRLLFLILGFSSVAFASSEISHISNKQISNLESEFALATSPSSETLKNKTWTCELFGLQTKMQRAHGKKLYRFLKNDLKNSGSMPIEQYQRLDTGIVGVRGPLQDEIRLQKKGSLISKLSAQQRPLSFAVCN